MASDEKDGIRDSMQHNRCESAKHVQLPCSTGPLSAALAVLVLLDLDAPGIHFVRAAGPDGAVPTSLVDEQGITVRQGPETGNFNAATIGYAVRRQLGAPIYAQMDQRP